MSMKQEQERAVFEALGSEAWTTVYQSWRRSRDANGEIYCAFAPPSRRQEAVSGPSWNLHTTSYAPGFSQHRSEAGLVTTYEPGWKSGEFEPLVLVREYYGVVPSSLEIVEEFRLFHNLYWDELTSQFMKPHDDGTSSAAIKMQDEKIDVRTKLLRQYQAARQLDLVLFIDSVKFGSEGEEPPEQMEWQTNMLRATLSAGDIRPSQPFTRYLGTRVLPPPPVEKSGIWPYEEEDDHYPEFIIGVDTDGDDVLYTCNEDALANYFGANPDAPHYLTPVHFRREVLQKYYEKPELYTVSDGYLHCASLWSVRVDNSAENSVVVFLGDLGRDLPKQERDYWRSFNIAPDSPVSDTLIRRAFMGQWAEPTAGDLQVRSKYVSLSRAWLDRFGWDLFKKPEEADAGLLQRLRLPLNDSQAEFEGSIRVMTQLFVDALNESRIQSLLPDRIPNGKGISKLERWLKQEGYPHVERDVKFLRNLQEARSKLVAHRKGSDYEKTLDRVFGKARGVAAIKLLFESALAMLTGLEEWVTAAGSSPPS